MSLKILENKEFSIYLKAFILGDKHTMQHIDNAQ